MVQYSPRLDDAFAALADPTRRGVLEHLGRKDASISELAGKFEITLTGMKKHVHILERSGLVATRKTGRVRTCALGPRRLEDAASWIDHYRRLQQARYDRLEAFLDRTKGKS